MPEPVADPTRYEQIMREHSRHIGDAAAVLCDASQAARSLVPVSSEHERVIRDVAAGVAAPALVGAVVWMLREAERRGLARLRFLSRDGQIFYELTRRLAPVVGVDIDIEYVYSSRLTWSLAASDPTRLDEEAWLFNSFMKSNAHDLCARLGLTLDPYRTLLATAGVSLDPDARADQPRQAEAMRRFLRTPQIADAVGDHINETRRMLVDYAAEHLLLDRETGLVDAGWTGRMINSLARACGITGPQRPHVLLWGYEPREVDQAGFDRVAAYMYNTATGDGLQWRVPDAPFLIETFCMGDHGIVLGYRETSAGHVQPVLQTSGNPAAEAWGLHTYRSTLHAFTEQLTDLPSQDLRPLIHQLMDSFWCHPSPGEAAAWGSYPYDSDPAATATRPLARPLDEHAPVRGDRAWIAGALALSSPTARGRYLAEASAGELLGTPAAD
ncbi:hypothetical protein [Nocardia sputi]|uniref:hypothetical protein n=1 Tax=Nocardia sputi TaxID=2943705 RepID=UPI0020C05F35|nr:hypothetical protein [Nocardia sputi]